MPRRQILSVCVSFLLLVALSTTSFAAKTRLADQVQVSPPPARNVEPPAADASPDQLEKQGDDLRARKLYLDAVDY
jgi:hypothetical protein